jgi:hypothetical protein
MRDAARQVRLVEGAAGPAFEDGDDGGGLLVAEVAAGVVGEGEACAVHLARAAAVVSEGRPGISSRLA